MSTTTTGRRPGQARPSPAVYRRRRIVALLVLLALVAAIIWGVTALFGRGKDADATPADAVAPAVVAEGTGGEDVPTEEPTDEVEACDLSALDAALEPVPEELISGATARFEVALTNPGESPCMVDAGPATLVAEVGSGSDAVWRSDHCADDATDERLLDAGAETSVALAWDGHRSAAGCPGDQTLAEPGTYQVSVTLDGEPVEPRSGHAFSVVAAPGATGLG